MYDPSAKMSDGYEKIGRHEIVKIPPIIESDAFISADRMYRYLLWRRWGQGQAVTFIMLNPSTADEKEDDATIRKCMGFAVRWGYAGIYVANLFSFRATHPKELLSAADPYGPDHRGVAMSLSLSWSGASKPTVVAWGSHGARISKLVQSALVGFAFRDAQCLGYAKDGSPRHPLVLSYDTPLQPFKKKE